MKNSLVQSYLFLDGKCEEAIEFYERALGANINMLMRYKESPEPPPPGCGPTDPNKIMHAQFQISETVIMASDGRATGNPKFEGFALSLTVNTEADADRATPRARKAEVGRRRSRSIPQSSQIRAPDAWRKLRTAPRRRRTAEAL